VRGNQNNAFSIATCHRPDSPGNESCREQDSAEPVQTAWGPSSLLHKENQVIPSNMTTRACCWPPSVNFHLFYDRESCKDIYTFQQSFIEKLQRYLHFSAKLHWKLCPIYRLNILRCFPEYVRDLPQNVKVMWLVFSHFSLNVNSEWQINTHSTPKHASWSLVGIKEEICLRIPM